MIYLLDTNAVIGVIRNRPVFRKRLRRLLVRRNSIAIGSVVLFELWYGVAVGRFAKENSQRLRTFLAVGVEVLPFQEEDAITAGNLRAELRKIGSPIGPYDLPVAAQALTSQAILATANVSEFGRIRELRLEDWTDLS